MCAASAGLRRDLGGEGSTLSLAAGGFRLDGTVGSEPRIFKLVDAEPAGNMGGMYLTRVDYSRIGRHRCEAQLEVIGPVGAALP